MANHFDSQVRKDKKCVVCLVDCSGDLSNFIDTRTGEAYKGFANIDKERQYVLYQSPVCLRHYKLTDDDLDWLHGTGEYVQ